MLMQKAKDPLFWKNAATDPLYQNQVTDINYLYSHLCGEDIKALKFSEYMIYFDSGSRKEYEAAYFERRGRLAASAVMCLLYPEEARYLTALQDTIWAICDEYCWALPAHADKADGVDTTRLDLFASETGFTMSEIYYLLEDRLDPFLKERMKYEINRRVIDSFATRRYFWESVDNNWAAVCAGSVGAAFMYMAPERFKEVKARIDAAMQAFLSSYKADGVCREGLGYWNYGFGYFVFYADLLKQFSEGEFDYFQDEKIRNIALFQQKMFLQGNTVVSFADGHMTGSMAVGLTHYLKAQYPDDIVVFSPGFHPAYQNGGGDHCYRWPGFIRNFTWYSAIFAAGEPLKNGCDYFADSAWYINKKDRYAFAAKAGDNNEPHNNNDIGCFILCVDGKQLICDVGAGEYTRQYFRPKTRYSFFFSSSRGHSVPIVGGQYQHEGVQYVGTVTQESDSLLELEMKDAYELAQLTGLRRKFELTDDAVILTDTFQFAEAPLPVTERFVTLTEPVVNEGSIKIGGLTLLYDSSICTASVTEEVYSNHQAIPTTAYCIDFVLRDPSVPFTARLQVEGTNH